MKEYLHFRAGSSAIEIIRGKGLQQDDIDIIAGAAGGPKWLVLSRIDRALFGEFLKERKRPLFLIGSSIGAWRFAAVTQKNPVLAIERFEERYIRQSYSAKPSPEEVSAESMRILEAYLGKAAAYEVLSHPYLRLNIFTDRSHGVLNSHSVKRLTAGLGAAALLNFFSRKAMTLFFTRTLFYDRRTLPPFFDMDDFPTDKAAFTPENLKAALMASGSIPAVMRGVENIPGAAEGIYRDGGMIDYHIDIPFKSKGLVLYPHFFGRIVPGWFDKYVPWHKPASHEKTLLVYPSPEFVESLPLKKIPDRKDLYLFAGKDKERIEYWNAVTERCKRLEDDFLEAVNSGSIKKRVQEYK
ncbi:MAG: patatin-like phospholipase family protein [Spirochaetia bacterium]|jgi:hypothetical protein|nr:patatin-like phospholipase family protein [Spirochaetia bacterium]